jgi:Zn-dependent protease with chaperone function
MNVRPKRVYELDLPAATAMAFVMQGTIAVTMPALDVLGDDELAAVCAHELAHLSESRAVRMTRAMFMVIAASLVSAPAAIQPIINTAGPIAIWWFDAALVAFAASVVLYRRLHRRMELRADALARQFEPRSGAYARALEKLYATNLTPVVVSTRRHRYPELYDRLVNSGAPPDYPRPAPPPSSPFYLGLLVLFAGVSAGSIALGALALGLAQV